MLKVIGGAQEGEFKAVASGTLPNGRPVVVNEDGTVSVAGVVDASVSTPTVFHAADMFLTESVFDSNSNKVVIAYRDDGNSRKGTAIVGTVSGGSITFGSDVVFDPSTEARPHKVVFDSNSNKIVICFKVPDTNGSAIVGTVSGNSISFGSPTTFTTNSVIYLDATFDSNSNKVVIVYRDETDSNRGRAVVGTVSGTSISFGSSSNFTTNTAYSVAVTFDSSNNKVVAAIRDGSNSNYGTAFVGTVSGTSISFGTGVVFESASTNWVRAGFDPNLNKVVIAYTDVANSNRGKAVVGTVSGTSISFGTAVVFATGAINAFGDLSRPTYDPTNQNFVFAYRDSGTPSNTGNRYGKYVVGTVSGTSISFGTPTVFSSVATSYISTVFDSNSNKIVISYKNDSDGDGYYVVYSPSGLNLTSENYIGMSRGVTEIIPSETGTAVTYDASETAYQAATFDSTNNKVVIGYRDYGNSNYGTAVVATVTGTTISYGSPSVFESGTTDYIVATFDSNAGKVVFVYQDGSNSSFATAVVGTVSGTSISFGTPVVFESSNSQNFGITFDSTNNKVVIAMRDSSGPGGDEQRGRAIVGTVSGTSISFGSATNFLADNTNAVSIAYDTTAQKVVISFQDSGSSNRGTAIVGTVSGTSISFGTAAQFELNEIASASATTYDPVNNKVLISYRDSTSGVGKAVVGTLSGTNISFGTAATFLSSNAVNITSAYDTETGAVVITYKNNSDNYTYAVAATISGTSVTFSDILTVENSNTTTDTASTYDTNANKSIATYKYNLASTSEGRAVVFKVGVENRFPIADGAAASIDIIGSLSTNQGGLTAGQQYFVQTDGTIGTTADSPSVLAGTAISATELLVKT